MNKKEKEDYYDKWRYYDKSTWSTRELRQKLIELDKELVEVQEELQFRGK